MIPAPTRGAQSSRVGEQTQHILTAAPRLNGWLFSKLAPDIRGDVLELGSGLGNFSGAIVSRAATTVLSDCDPSYLERLDRAFGGDARVQVVRYDLESDPPRSIADRRFDAIVAINVIEHVMDDAGLVRRLVALLRPGGALLIYTPACPGVFCRLDRALLHHRRYTPASLVALLRGAGLSVGVPKYFNVVGLIGWTVNGLILRRGKLSAAQMAIFERLVPLWRLEDKIRLPVGLGLWVVARSPGP